MWILSKCESDFMNKGIVQMKNFDLEPTYENIKKTLKDNIIGRNEELYNFFSILDSIDGNMSIALDSGWGTGKTFFVKQIETLLNYYYGLSKNKQDNELGNIIQQDDSLNKITLNKIFIPIYYNAWLYDDHSDPILSLMYSIVKDNHIEYVTEIKSALSKNMEKIIKTFAILKEINSDISNIIDWENADNLIDKIESLESIKSVLKDVFNQIINEHADKLIIFIDELDRCNPKYAISVLERIKHFFQDDRIIFVYSTNKSQLVHTIKKFYGNDFDASGYLNKFFDFSMKLGKVNMHDYAYTMNLINDDSEIFNIIAREMINYYHFSMRECHRYLQIIKSSAELVNFDRIRRVYVQHDGLCWIILFAPIVFALRIYDIEKSEKFESGILFEELENILKNNHNISECFKSIIESSEEATLTAKSSWELIVENIYGDIFSGTKTSQMVSDCGRKMLKDILEYKNIR